MFSRPLIAAAIATAVVAVGGVSYAMATNVPTTPEPIPAIAKIDQPSATTEPEVTVLSAPEVDDSGHDANDDRITGNDDTPNSSGTSGNGRTDDDRNGHGGDDSDDDSSGHGGGDDSDDDRSGHGRDDSGTDDRGRGSDDD